jgi:hypothetical protein
VTASGRPNEGVAFLVGQLAETFPGEPGWLEAVRVAAAAVAAGWMSWAQVAAELDGLTEAFDGLTADAAQARFGSGLDGDDAAGVLAALQAVDAEATEPRCGTCGAPVAMFLGRDRWRHLEFRETPAGVSRLLLETVDHAVTGPMWTYGPAAVPVDQVRAEPSAADFDAAGRDRVFVAGAELLGIVHDIDFHHYSYDGWPNSLLGDTAEAASELRDMLDRLERAVAAARSELDATERIARALAAHRRGRGDAGCGDR